MRPSAALGIGVLLLVVAGGALTVGIVKRRAAVVADWAESRALVKTFGISDLAVTTEARYTRHPAASDSLVPFMDHPGGGLEHFPSGSFSAPVRP